jgi:hypothetical protein
LKGALRVESEGGAMEVNAGQAVVCRKREWGRYSAQGKAGAE